MNHIHDLSFFGVYVNHIASDTSDCIHAVLTGRSLIAVILICIPFAFLSFLNKSVT